MGLIGLAAIGWILKSLCENGIPHSWDRLLNNYQMLERQRDCTDC